MVKLDKNLENLYSDVKDCLKFAEAKNGALVTFDSACIFFLLNILVKEKVSYLLIIETIYCCIFIISVLLSLLSYTPKINDSDIFELLSQKFIGIKSINDNFLFYKHIAKYSEAELENHYLRLFNKTKFSSEYEKVLIKQIKSISSLAYKKYFMFYLSLFIILIAILFLLVLIIVA